jgi:uncharacterized OsmC-like protein
MDEPESFHGQDKGPSAVEYFLIGVGGCTGSSFAYCLEKNSIPVKDLQIIVDGKMSHRGDKLNLRLIKIEIEIKGSIGTHDTNKLDKCINQFKDYCVISESISKGIPLNFSFNIQNKKS